MILKTQGFVIFKIGKSGKKVPILHGISTLGLDARDIKLEKTLEEICTKLSRADSPFVYGYEVKDTNLYVNKTKRLDS